MEPGVSGSFKWMVVNRKAFKSPSVFWSVVGVKVFKTCIHPLICKKTVRKFVDTRRKISSTYVNGRFLYKCTVLRNVVVQDDRSNHSTEGKHGEILLGEFLVLNHVVADIGEGGKH